MSAGLWRKNGGTSMEACLIRDCSLDLGFLMFVIFNFGSHYVKIVTVDGFFFFFS